MAKKIYRLSQSQRILGKPLAGMHMHKYGMPYRNSSGYFCPENPDDMDLIFSAVERYPELHIVTDLKSGGRVNRFEKENVFAYYLYKGNPDPEIEISEEWDSNDFTPEERARSEKFFEEFRKDPFGSIEVQMALRWLAEDVKKNKPKG